MTDEYPPFRLDQGGDEPGTLRTAPGGGTALAPPAGRDRARPAPRPWSAGRVVSVVVGSLLLLGAIGTGLAGGALAFADTTMRDDAGFLMSGRADAHHRHLRDHLEQHGAARRRAVDGHAPRAAG